MTSNEYALELIERLRESATAYEASSFIGDNVNGNDLREAADLLEHHHKLAIAAGYPEGVEAMAEGVKAMRAELEALAVYAPQYAQRINAALTKGPSA